MAAADAAVHVDIHNRTRVHERVAGQSRFIIAKQIAFIRNSTFRYKRMMDAIRDQVYVL